MRARVLPFGGHEVAVGVDALFSGSTPVACPWAATCQNAGRLGAGEMPARIRSIQVARRYNIRCRICPEIGDEFPAIPATFSPSRVLEAARDRRAQRQRCSAARVCASAKKRAARRRENPNEGMVISTPGRRAWQARRYVRPSEAHSGCVPAEGSNVRLNALPFIPDHAKHAKFRAFSRVCSGITLSGGARFVRAHGYFSRTTSMIASASRSRPSTPSLLVSSVTESHSPVGAWRRIAL